MDRDDELQLYIMGYSDKLSVQQGNDLEIKVSTTESDYRVEIVRFDHYFSDPDPGRDTVMVSASSGSYPGRLQEIAIGSYIGIPGVDGIDMASGLTLQCWVQAGLAQHDQAQGIVSRRDPESGDGFELYLSAEGLLTFEIAETMARLGWRIPRR